MTLADKFDYKRACEYTEEAASLGSRPGLERIRRLCDLLGNPEDKLRFIHIAGTNGKGSTAAMIASALKCAGVLVGMYYSPALCGITDHYRINGELISEDEYAECVSEVAAANEKLIEETGDGATQFELETCVAFVFFGKNHCDAVILETGMGGRDDATNIVSNKICCVFTSISYDHMQYLGNTLSKIADVKSGIITSACPVIAYASDDEVTDTIRRRCDTTGSTLYVVDPADIAYDDTTPYGMIVDYGKYLRMDVGLAGAFQAANAAVAVKTLEVIGKGSLLPGFSIDEDIIRKGLADVKWPFRFERINDDPYVYVDGAHNEDAAKKLRATIDERLPGYRIILVAGMFRDKEYDKVMNILASRSDMVFAVETPDNARALPAAELAKCARKYCENVKACDSIKDAYDEAVSAAKDSEGKSAVIAAGSLSYLNDFVKSCREHGKS